MRAAAAVRSGFASARKAPPSLGATPQPSVVVASLWRSARLPQLRPRVGHRAIRTLSVLRSAETASPRGGGRPHQQLRRGFVSSTGSDDDGHAAVVQILESMLAEEQGLSPEQRALIESTLAKARDPDGAAAALAEMHATIDAKIAEEEESESSSADLALGPEAGFEQDFIERLTADDRTNARKKMEMQQDVITEDEARTLFDNLLEESENLDDQQIYDRNVRRLLREQKLIDKDVERLASWAGRNSALLERYDADEASILAVEGEAEVSPEEAFDPPADRLDPLLLLRNHSTAAGSTADGDSDGVWKYSWQEMMEAEIDRDTAGERGLVQEAARKRETRAKIGDATEESVRVRQVDEKGQSHAVGYKKTSIARVRLVPAPENGDGGDVTVNGRSFDRYFPYYNRWRLLTPFEVTGTMLQYNVNAKVAGGGLASQMDALRFGIARAIEKQDPAKFRPPLKAAMLLTRDSRVVERKKSGQKKARKKFTWVKR